MNKFKLFFLRNKEKLFRFLTVFMSCIVLSFSVLPFNSLANPSSRVYSTPYSQPQVTSNSGYIEFTTSNGWALTISFVASNFLDTNSIAPTFKARVVNGWLLIHIVQPYDSANTVLTGCYIDVIWNTYGGLEAYEDVFQDGLMLHYWLGNAGSITAAHGYNCDVSMLSSSADFTFVYGSDTVVNQKLDTIKSAVNSVESTLVELNTTNINKLNQLIELVMTSNSNLSLIQSILQEEGTLTRSKLDTIINYLQSAENGAYYNPSNDGTAGAVTNQQQKDEQVFAGTETGRVEASNSITGLSGLLTTTGAVFKGSTAITKVFNLFAQSAYIAPILQISLVLGIASFVLGSAFIVIGKIRNKKE